MANYLVVSKAASMDDIMHGASIIGVYQTEREADRAADVYEMREGKTRGCDHGFGAGAVDVIIDPRERRSR